MLSDGQGVPLVAEVSAANVPDVHWPLPLVDAAADLVAAHRQRPRPPGRRTKTERGLGKVRWSSERTISWLHQSRRLRTHYEQHAWLHQAFLSLACSLICFRRL